MDLRRYVCTQRARLGRLCMYVPGRPALAGFAWSYADMYVLGGPALNGLAWSYADMYLLGAPTLVGLELCRRTWWARLSRP